MCRTHRIRLGDSIVVTVVRVAGDKVRLGIEAPADILVLRDELEPRVAPPAADNAAASSQAIADQPAADQIAADVLDLLPKAIEAAELSDISELVDLEVVITRKAPGAAA